MEQSGSSSGCYENNILYSLALCPNHHWEYDNTDFQIEPYLNEIKDNKRNKNSEIAEIA